MKRRILGMMFVCFLSVMITGCSDSGTSSSENGSVQREKKIGDMLEIVEVPVDTPLHYLPVSQAKASSFDQTPDWAPEPNSMAAVDSDMMTRWSSDYESSEQWIYFDLGSESVVNDVIIRWENAYATKFLILVSKDAENWSEVYREDNGIGGVTEAIFPAVKGRYIKILGTEKVKDQWGISIWEVEAYGPGSLNPAAALSKEEYLGKSTVEDNKEAVQGKIEKLSSPIVSIKEQPFQKGVVYTSWTADELSSIASDATLADLKEMGFNTVALMVPAYQETLNSENIFINDGPGGDTPTQESLQHAIETCHKLGMRVMMKVHVDPRTDEARINIMPSENWFNSYEELILRYAIFSAANKVELFSIGTELEATTFDAWNHRWQDIISKIRLIYKGELTYSANWTEYKEVPFWHDLDFVGIDAYFPLTEDDAPTLEELKSAWTKHADEIEKWLTEKDLTDKGVVFTEIGYTSTDGASRQPWAAVSNREDQQEQADCLQATFDVLSQRPWFKGYEIWQYMPQERWSPLGFTINGKKAEAVVREFLQIPSALEKETNEKKVEVEETIVEEKI
jgi:glycosyl hydrolase family 113/F5/8 type C domain-containing protein